MRVFRLLRGLEELLQLLMVQVESLLISLEEVLALLLLAGEDIELDEVGLDELADLFDGHAELLVDVRRELGVARGSEYDLLTVVLLGELGVLGVHRFEQPDGLLLGQLHGLCFVNHHTAFPQVPLRGLYHVLQEKLLRLLHVRLYLVRRVVQLLHHAHELPRVHVCKLELVNCAVELSTFEDMNPANILIKKLFLLLKLLRRTILWLLDIKDLACLFDTSHD